jgi:hypothetical protein
MVTVLVLVRLILVTTFAVAAGAKLSTPNRTRRSIEQFGVPANLAGFVGVVLPLFELVVALGLMLEAAVHVAAAAALGLLVALTAAIVANLWNGRRPECACFGGFRPAKIGAWTVARNVVLVAAAALLLACGSNAAFVQPRERSASPQVMVVVLVAGLGLGLAAISLGMWRRSNRPTSARRFFAGSSKVAKDGVRLKMTPPPPAGLAVGASAPRFALRFLDGGALTLEKLGRGGRSALLVFASPVCAQCAAILPAVSRLQDTGRDRLNTAVIVSGDPEAARGLIGCRGLEIAAADERAEVARLFRVPALPSAVLIDPNGMIASETKVGALAVLNLVAQLAMDGVAAEAGA